MWKIKCFQKIGSVSEIQQTYDSGTNALKAELEVALEYLRVQKREDWCRPRAAKLSKCKKFRDFFEIRMFADRLQQRPIGFFGPKEHEFTILIWATEKGGKLIPENWCEKADRLRDDVISGNASSVDLILEGDDSVES